MIFINSLFMLLAYLLGSVSSAIITCKVMRLPDPRTHGSRNPGATNVLRIGGKLAALITLFGDLLKGLIPVLCAKWFDLSTPVISAVAIAAFIGHLYPIFFRFEGGKGVATLIGCLLAFSWQAGGLFLLTWLVIAFLFRYSSLAALVATLLAPVYIWYCTNPDYTLAVIFMGLLLFYRHQQNIKNLLSGSEKKIGHKD